jgi:hypothetical protein
MHENVTWNKSMKNNASKIFMNLIENKNEVMYKNAWVFVTYEASKRWFFLTEKNEKHILCGAKLGYDNHASDL